MLRPAAVRALLLQEIAGLPSETNPLAALDRLNVAMRRAGLVALVDIGAIAFLLAMADRSVPFLTLGANERTAFTIGVLGVALHAGFRLAQLLTLRAVRRAVESLPGEE